MLLELSRLSVPPGQWVLLHDISWQELEAILEELGEHRASRIAYENGALEIMTPLAEHEDDKEIIGDLVKALLEELDNKELIKEGLFRAEEGELVRELVKLIARMLRPYKNSDNSETSVYRLTTSKTMPPPLALAESSHPSQTSQSPADASTPQP